MNFLKRLLMRLSGRPPSLSQKGLEEAIAFDGRRHCDMLAYFRKLWAGEGADLAFEAQKLNFTFLNFAELILAMSRELNLSIKDVLEFLQQSTGTEPSRHGVFTETVVELSKLHSEQERAILLQDDDILSEESLQPVALDLDTVGFLRRYCAAIELWCKRDSGETPKFPAVNQETDMEIPSHMQGRHPDDIRDYHAHRKELGNPFSRPARDVVCEFILSHMIRRAKLLDRKLSPPDLERRGVRAESHFDGDLEMDTHDFVEAIGALADHYDNMFRVDGAVFDGIQTVGDLIRQIENQLPELR